MRIAKIFVNPTICHINNNLDSAQPSQLCVLTTKSPKGQHQQQQKNIYFSSFVSCGYCAHHWVFTYNYQGRAKISTTERIILTIGNTTVV